jgi:hypothetical protein
VCVACATHASNCISTALHGDALVARAAEWQPDLYLHKDLSSAACLLDGDWPARRQRFHRQCDCFTCDSLYSPLERLTIACRSASIDNRLSFRVSRVALGLSPPLVSSIGYREGSKSNISCCAAGVRNTCMMFAGYVTHIVREFCARYIREYDANVARTCRARSAQQGMLLLDPALYEWYISEKRNIRPQTMFFPVQEPSLLQTLASLPPICLYPSRHSHRTTSPTELSFNIGTTFVTLMGWHVTLLDASSSSPKASRSRSPSRSSISVSGCTLAESIGVWKIRQSQDERKNRRHLSREIETNPTTMRRTGDRRFRSHKISARGSPVRLAGDCNPSWVSKMQNGVKIPIAHSSPPRLYFFRRGISREDGIVQNFG